jgi:hypothetical protein
MEGGREREFEIPNAEKKREKEGGRERERESLKFHLASSRIMLPGFEAVVRLLQTEEHPRLNPQT